LGATSLSAYSVGSGDTFLIQQNIEGFNVADLDWGTANAKTVTLSFWVRSSLTGTFGGSTLNSAANRSYPFSYTISSANTWEQKTITIAGDTTGTWLTNNGIGIGVRFGLGSGSTFSGTVNVWQAGNIGQPTGSVSVVGTNGATWYITGVQLEVGTSATPFERRLYGQELINCQRYYSVNGNGCVGVFYGTNQIDIGARHPVTMRATPSYTAYVGAFTVDEMGVASRTFTNTASSPAGIGVSSTGWMIYGFSSSTSVGATALNVACINSDVVFFSAEL
jgi:hypothetical protein